MSDTHKEVFFYFGVNSLHIAPCICPIYKFIKGEKKKHFFFPRVKLINCKQGFRVVLKWRIMEQKSSICSYF